MIEETFTLTSEAAKELSQLGAAKGGQARAKKLSPERRREIAQAAVEARWLRAGKEPIPFASYPGEIKIGSSAIECAVLDDGRRVLSQRSVGRALGKGFGGKDWQGDAGKLPFFLTAKNLRPFVSNELETLVSKPIVYRDKSGGRTAYGLDATVLPQVCDVWLKARDAKVLKKAQLPIAAKAEILIRGLAHVGIIALIDEATGYQDERARNALAKILEAFIAKELRAWVKTFPAEFYKELFRLRGIPYKESVKRPQYVGHLTNDLIYARLAPGVLEELRRLTPRDEKGRLRSHLHRRLTEDLGHPKLLQHLSAITALMKASDSWRVFKPLLDRALPRYKRLPLFDGLEPREGEKK